MKFKYSLVVCSAVAFHTSAYSLGTDPGPVTLSVGGQSYRVTTIQGTYNNLTSTLSLTPWNGGAVNAGQIVESYKLLGYFPNYIPALNQWNPEENRTPYAVDPSDLTRVYYANSNGGSGAFVPNAGFLDTVLWWLVPVDGPSADDTKTSLQLNSEGLTSSFNLQSSKIALGLRYDCTVYDQKNVCVSFIGSKSDGKSFDATNGALIIAYKPTNNFRFGGYIDQSFGSSTSGGLTMKRGTPGFGSFAVWSQNADGSGIQVRAAANVGKADIESTRQAIGTAEAGFGKSNIKSTGFQWEVSKAYAINTLWSARPYVGYRKTINTRAGYTETDAVNSPLTYDSLKQSTDTLTAGATFAHALSAKTTMFLTAGVEHDLKNRIDSYAATSADIQNIDAIDMGSNQRKTRPTTSFALNHDIDKTQRVGVLLIHRKEAFASASTTSGFLQYSKGF